MASWTSGYVADIGYTHGFYRELTPAILGLAALAKGIRGPDLSKPLTYCELGCGQGFSTNLLAAANPDIEFWANDFNPSHVVGARSLAAAAGSGNVHFFDWSFEEFLDAPDVPDFDFISLHGIYSWISAQNRAHIVEFIRRRLKPGGLVYISYNSLPGWSAAAPLRELLTLHARTSAGASVDRIGPAMDFIERLLGANAGYFRANPGLKDRFEKLKGQNRQYLAHEYLNADWTLFYHADVAQELERAKLSYLGSAHILDHVDAVNLTPEQQALLRDLPDPVVRETMRDYIINQQFRRDIFVKGAVPLSQPEQNGRWSAHRFVLSANRAEVPMKVTGSLGEAVLQEEVYGPVLESLSSTPKTVQQMMSEPAIAPLGAGRVLQALLVLIGAGHLQPALDARGDGKRQQRTRAFNTAVMTHSQGSTDLMYLASPVTGSGIAIDRISQLLLLATQNKHADPVQQVWSTLASQNQRMLKDGKALESAEENLAELRERLTTFRERQLPVLQRLGIA